MDDLADELIEHGVDPDVIQDVTGLDENELAERYLENGHSISETASELGLDEEELLDQYGDDYDYE